MSHMKRLLHLFEQWSYTSGISSYTNQMEAAQDAYLAGYEQAIADKTKEYEDNRLVCTECGSTNFGAGCYKPDKTECYDCGHIW